MSEDKKLVGVGTSGDYVLNNQTIAKEEGFSNVSKIWYDKTMSYEQLAEKLELERREQRDLLKPKSKIDVVNADNTFYVKIEDEFFKPTEHAIKQMATACDVSHTIVQELQKDKLKPNSIKIKYRRDSQDRDTLVAVFRNGLRRVSNDKVFRMRTYTDGTLRAFVTDEYQVIQNAWYLEQLEKLLPQGRVSHWKGNADWFAGNILMPDSVREEKDSGYGGMISGGNSEIGGRCFEQTPSLFRAICMNGCIWDKTEGYSLRYVHKRSHIDLNDLRELIADNIQKQIPLIPTIIAQFLGTKDMKLEKGDKIKKLVAQLGVDFKLEGGHKGHGVAILEEFSKYESNDRNLFGIINSVTRAGQKLGRDEWYNFDVIGGTLMNYTTRDWEALRTKAGYLKDEKVDKFYGIEA